MYEPPCTEQVGYVPEVTSDHAPDVPETCAVAQPVLLSNPLLNNVAPPPDAVEVKLTPVWLAPLIVTLALAGLNVYPERLGVTVYVPFARPLKV